MCRHAWCERVPVKGGEVPAIPESALVQRSRYREYILVSC
jgi:hypothetical protein